MGRIETFEIEMSPLMRTRTVRVYLPAAYDLGEASFPVIYLHDGQDMFHVEGSDKDDWGVNVELASLEERGLPYIAVAVDHAGTDRADEYAPWKFEKMYQRFTKGRIHGGDGEAYGEFYVNKLMPLINATYRTKTGSENTVIVGSSMGAFITLYMAFEFPNLFGKVGLFSTALWFSKTEMFKYLRQKTCENSKFFVSVGTKESLKNLKFDFNKVFVENSRDVVKILEERGVPADSIAYELADGGLHNEKAWCEMFKIFTKRMIG